jgi:hypothetical protein
MALFSINLFLIDERPSQPCGLAGLFHSFFLLRSGQIWHNGYDLRLRAARIDPIFDLIQFVHKFGDLGWTLIFGNFVQCVEFIPGQPAGVHLAELGKDCRADGPK